MCSLLHWHCQNHSSVLTTTKKVKRFSIYPVFWLFFTLAILFLKYVLEAEAKIEFHFFFISVCSLLQTGIAGIFGPQSDVTSMHVQSICDAIDIPHVETRWDFQLQRADMSINLFPRPSVLSQAYVDLVKIWGWRSFSLVYDEHEGKITSIKSHWNAYTGNWEINFKSVIAGEAEVGCHKNQTF